MKAEEFLTVKKMKLSCRLYLISLGQYSLHLCGYFYIGSHF